MFSRGLVEDGPRLTTIIKYNPSPGVLTTTATTCNLQKYHYDKNCKTTGNSLSQS